MALQGKDKAECRKFKDVDKYGDALDKVLWLVYREQKIWDSDNGIHLLAIFIAKLKPLIENSGCKVVCDRKDKKEDLSFSMETMEQFLVGKDQAWKQALVEALNKGFTEDQWDDFANLDIIEVDPMKVTSAVEKLSSTATAHSWNESYKGRSHELLWKHISNYYMKSEGAELYANMCAIVQSSGMGKSRVVNELGKTHFVIPMNLGKTNSGYPPPDADIRDYLVQDFANSDKARRQCFLFLLGLFSQTLGELQRAREMKFARTKQEMIQWFHNQISPPGKKEFRARFWNDVLRSATQHGVTPAPMKHGRPVSLVSMLVASAKALVKFLRKASPQDKQDDKIEVVLAFDEAHVLCENVQYDMTSGGRLWSMFYMLREALQSLRSIPIWGLFISTTGKLSQFNPHHGVDPSMRIRDEQFKSVPAFTTLRYDLFTPRLKRTDDGRLWHSMSLDNTSSPPRKKSGTVVKGKALTLEQVTKTEFLVRFGRPLFYLIWHHGDDLMRNNIIRFAMSKLICADPDLLTTTWECGVPVNAAFACLSQRLCIEFNPAKNNTDEEMQIMLHMRLCLKVDTDNQSFVSSSGSDPVLAEAAATIMQMDIFKAAGSLKHVVSWFGVKKGDRGELVGLLAATRARDLAVKKRIRDFGVSDTPDVLPLEDERSKPMFRAVTVMEFLSQLFSLKELKKSDLDGLSADFKDAYVYFNHFIRPFDDSTCIPRCLLLYMTRGAAVVCSTSMPGIDAVVPTLFKSSNGLIFLEDHLGVVFLQMENSTCVSETHNRDLIKRDIAHVLPSVLGNTGNPRPIIHITFSFGSQEGLLYSKSTITLNNGESVTMHDFWCGGIGDFLLPDDDESKSSWEALLSATMKSKVLFEEKNAGLKEIGAERKSMTPGGSSEDAFWGWVKETDEVVVENEEESEEDDFE